MILLIRLTFLLGFQTVILIVLPFWIYFFLLTLVFFVIVCWHSCFCVSFHWISIKFTKGFPVSSHSLWLFSCWLGRSSWLFERCSMGRISLKSLLLLLLLNIVSDVLIGIDVYTPHRKYQVKLHSFPWFSAACAAAIVHRNYFFVCTKRINLSILKYIIYRLVIVAKAFLKLLNLHMLIKQKSLLLPRNLALGTFGELLIVFSTKINLLYLLYSAVQRYCLVHLIKQNFSSKLS